MYKLSAKQLAIVILTATATSANAQVYSPNTYTGSGFCRTGFVGVEGNYFRPYSENLLGGEEPLDLLTVNNFWGDPDYDFGFRLFGGFYLCDRDYVGADYSHYDQDFHWTLPAEIFGVDRRVVRVDYHYDDANLVLGHSFSTCKWNVNVFGGLEYARIKRHKSTLIDFFDVENELDFIELAHNAKFDGYGPVVGFEAAYNLPCNFQIVGGASDAVLVNRLSLDAVINTGNGVSTRDTFDRRKILANNLYAKLGLAYSTCFSCTKVRIEGGYKVHSYFAPDGGEGSIIRFRRSAHPFSFGTSGPYLGVSVGF